MKLINGTPMIELLLARLSRSRELDQIVVASSVDVKNIPLVGHVRTLGYACEQGSENDVLERYVLLFVSQAIVRWLTLKW
jgi:glutamate-1-semialdehyde 2,1-aminomutase